MELMEHRSLLEEFAHLVCFMVFGFVITIFLIIRADADDNGMSLWIELHYFLDRNFLY